MLSGDVQVDVFEDNVYSGSKLRWRPGMWVGVIYTGLKTKSRRTGKWGGSCRRRDSVLFFAGDTESRSHESMKAGKMAPADSNSRAGKACVSLSRSGKTVGIGASTRPPLRG